MPPSPSHPHYTNLTISPSLYHPHHLTLTIPLTISPSLSHPHHLTLTLQLSVEQCHHSQLQTPAIPWVYKAILTHSSVLTHTNSYCTTKHSQTSTSQPRKNACNWLLTVYCCTWLVQECSEPMGGARHRKTPPILHQHETQVIDTETGA